MTGIKTTLAYMYVFAIATIAVCMVPLLHIFCLGWHWAKDFIDFIDNLTERGHD